MKKRVIAVILILLSAGLNLTAQDTLKLSGVEVYGEYRPSIADAEKKNIYPDATRPPAPKRDYTYKTSSFVMMPEPVIRMPEPRKFGDTLPSRVRGNYARIGFGNYTTPLAELYLHNLRSKEASYGLSVNHRSSNGPELADFSRTEVAGYGERYLKSGIIYGNAGYTGRGYRYYGADREHPSFSEDTSKIFYNHIHAGAGYRSKSTIGKMGWGTGVDYHFFNNQNEDAENDLKVTAYLNFPFKNGNFDLPLELNSLGYQSGNFKLDRLFIRARPTFTFNWKRFELQGGLNFVSMSVMREGLVRTENPFFFDTLGKFRVFPIIKANFEIDPKTIYLDVSIQGDIKANTFRQFANINPFLHGPVNLNSTRQNVDLMILLRGKLSSRTTVRGGIRAQALGNLPLYLTDSGMLRSFHVLSDDASVIGAIVEGQYQWGEKLQLIGKGEFNSYNMKNQDAPWQLPTAIISLHGRYDIAQKIVTEFGLTYFNARDTRVAYVPMSERKLDAVTDLGLKLEYRWKKNISAFVEFSNILGRRYEIWRNYPALGFQGLGGITFSL